ncbi:MAG: hypothetical protein ACRC42_02510 [Mycoplasma sp.]
MPIYWLQGFEKRSKILKAEAEKEALIWHAEAVKKRYVMESEGEAKAIEIIQKEKASDLEMIKSEIQSIVGFASVAKEIVNNKRDIYDSNWRSLIL